LNDLLERACERPEYYLQKFNFEAGTGVFSRMSRQSFRDSAFLDERLQAAGESQFELPLTGLLGGCQQPGQTGRQPAYLFHTAYCCSTLLSRALDVAGRTLVYREPVALHQLAVMQRRRNEVPDALLQRWDTLLGLAIRMLSKSWSPAEVPVIKATDSCNNIINRLLGHSPGSAALLLYSQLGDFLVANLKSDGRRQFLRRLLGRSILDAAADPLLREVDARSLDDARAAAFVWMVQMLSYRNALEGQAGRCRALDVSHLLARPERVLPAVADHLGLALTDEEVSAVLQGPVWHTHSKDGSIGEYNAQERARDKTSLSLDLEREIMVATDWVRTFPGWSGHIEFAAALNPGA